MSDEKKRLEHTYAAVPMTTYSKEGIVVYEAATTAPAPAQKQKSGCSIIDVVATLALVASTVLLIATMVPPRVLREKYDAVVGFVFPHTAPAAKVPIELFVMSRCPDAALCEGNIFAEVVRQVKDIVTIDTHYIATPDNNARFGAKCMHGDLECDGNVHQLCARKLAGDRNPEWFSFIECQLQDRSSIGKPASVERCAPAAGLLAAEIFACAETEGRALHQQSIAYTQSHPDVKKSCTMYIAGTKRCVHDAIYKECKQGHDVADFVRQICLEYKGSDVPVACRQIIEQDELRAANLAVKAIEAEIAEQQFGEMVIYSDDASTGTTVIEIEAVQIDVPVMIA